MYRICICDDETSILDNIYEQLKKEFIALGLQAEYRLFDDSRKLIEYLEKENVDLLLLDIDMPYFNGMDVAEFVNKRKMNTILVFVTSYDALVYKTFAYKPFAFIRKNYFLEDMKEFTQRICAELEERKTELLFSKGTCIQKIKISDIVFIESEGNYVNLVTKAGIYKYRGTLSELEAELVPKKFVRCHKGYLVNSGYIVKFEKVSIKVGGLEKVADSGYIIDENGCMYIPVGRSYEKDTRKSILESMR